jgi:PAS domain S-box-containing protein
MVTKPTNEGLATKADFYQKIVDNCTYMISLHDQEGRYLYASPFSKELTGYNPEELTSQNSYNFIHPDDIPCVEEIHKAIVNDGQAIVVSYRIRHKSGHYVWVETTSKVVKHKSGSIEEIIATTREITLRKKAEEDLKETEERNLTLVESLIQPLAHHEVICDSSVTPINYRFLYVNQAFGNLFGKSPSEIVGKTVLELLPEIEPSWIETFGKVALEGEPIRFEEYSQELDRHFDVVAYSPEKGQFTVVANEITERIQAENLLKRNISKFQSLVESIKTIPWEYDIKQDSFTYVGEQIKDILGVQPSEWQSLSDWQEMIHPEDREEAVSFCLIETKKGANHDFTYRMLTRDGHCLWVQDVVSVIMGDEGPEKLCFRS